ncbi:MAG: HD domain-containing protein [Oscillospiraceae bacterium]|nr:HD domain-containing protein [Oscillospiraceae bacterium]
MIDRYGVTEAFARYVSAYDIHDPQIALKIGHTYRVAELCERIGREAGAPDPDLAWLCGMLHDIGRFEQIRRYHTFVDADSVDHARLGADLLFCEGLLEAFPAALSGPDAGILQQSIRNHSLRFISENLTETQKVYCHVLRDADKIDIFRVNCETPLEDIYHVTTQELRTSTVSEDVREAFRNRTTVERKLRKTAVDFVAAGLCMTFDLIYPISREIARQQGYVDRLAAFESDNPDTRAWFSYMREHLWEE